MASQEDIRASKALRQEIAKRMIDITGADLRVMHGVAYIKGVVKPIKGGPQNLAAELELVSRVLRNSPRMGIKDVIIDCAIRS